MNILTIAIDFDGTLCAKGKPNAALFAQMRREQASGSNIILHTCRTGKQLTDAIRFCAAHGLRLNGAYGGKPEADIYIDDKAIKPIWR